MLSSVHPTFNFTLSLTAGGGVAWGGEGVQQISFLKMFLFQLENYIFVKNLSSISLIQLKI